MARRIAVVATFAAGIAAVEWWSLLALEGHHVGGPLTGAVAMAGLLAIAGIGPRARRAWGGAWVAALTAVLELAFCVALVASFSAIAAWALPVSLSRRFLQGEVGADFVLLAVSLLALAVAARAWSKVAARSVEAARASADAAQARTAVAERERELARSELLLLKAQIEPHFLWNTLAHVKYLALKSPADAALMTEHLIRFLMSAVPDARRGATTLGSELASAQAYLEIMKIRMGQRLAVSVTVEDALREVPFPPLLLQTLVENAIKHGIEPKVGAARLAIRVARVAGDAPRIALEVVDDGVGLQADAPTSGTGLGLRSLRERLEAHYGSAASLRIVGAEAGGVTARIEFPMPAGAA